MKKIVITAVAVVIAAGTIQAKSPSDVLYTNTPTKRQQAMEKKLETALTVKAYREAYRKAKADYEAYMKQQNETAQADTTQNHTAPQAANAAAAAAARQAANVTRPAAPVAKTPRRSFWNFFTRFVEKRPDESLELWNSRLYQMAK